LPGEIEARERVAGHGPRACRYAAGLSTNDPLPSPRVEGKRFELAPMSRGIRALTIALLALPLLFAALAVLRPVRVVMLGAALCMRGLFAAVWLLGRPPAFDLTDEGLRIRFPLRTRLVPAREIASVRALAVRTFRDEFGLAMRIGVGGLWGAFGWLWTKERG